MILAFISWWTLLWVALAIVVIAIIVTRISEKDDSVPVEEREPVQESGETDTSTETEETVYEPAVPEYSSSQTEEPEYEQESEPEYEEDDNYQDSSNFEEPSDADSSQRAMYRSVIDEKDRLKTEADLQEIAKARDAALLAEQKAKVAEAKQEALKKMSEFINRHTDNPT